jgi:hypothetical protein
MIFVFETNGSLLYLFSSAAEAESHLEAIDIENNEYEFCDDTGQRFVGNVTKPITKFGAGSFNLKPDGKPDKAFIASFLSHARSLDQSCNGVKNLDDLRRLYVS